MDNKIYLALCICTYKRTEQLYSNLEKIRHTLFFQKERNNWYYHCMQVFVVDNACELKEEDNAYIHIMHNPKGNVGGSGGFQYGINLARKSQVPFSHFIFMDDDVEFENKIFYTLFDFLKSTDQDNLQRPIAGRMFCLQKKDVQYTAAEKWNAGDIEHIGYMQTADQVLTEKEFYIETKADYGGWWFCCYPWEFVKKNDIMPFFIHCDDVEYGLRCGKHPIILRDVFVWHELAQNRQKPIINYYDIRNSLIVNKMYNINQTSNEIWINWKNRIGYHHARKDYLSEYYGILAMRDYMRGTDWLHEIHPGQYHNKLIKKRTSKLKNAVLWRLISIKFKTKR